MNLKIYSPAQDLTKGIYPLYYSFTSYELLKPSEQRKGHIVENVGRVPVLVHYGLELVSLYPPYPVVYEVILEPGQCYLGDVPEIIPLATRWFRESSEFGLAELAVTELY